MKILDRDEISDILLGCAIFGTGGGGELAQGLYYIDMALAAGKVFKMLSLDEIADEQMVCTPYMLGALVEPAKACSINDQSMPAIWRAFEKLQQYQGGSQFHTICCELGAENTAIAFYLAAMCDGCILDADPAGRAVPEITHSTYYLNNLPVAPIIMANNKGESFICEDIADDRRAETIVRAIAMLSDDDIAVIDHVLPAAQIKNAVIAGTLSKAHALGRAFRQASCRGQDIATEIASQGNGYVAFVGQVTDFHFSAEGGFTLGVVKLQGTGQYHGSHYQISSKNENLSAHLNGQIDVTIPELICCLNIDDKDIVTNPNFKLAMNVAVVVLPAAREFISEQGLTVFGPAYAGLTHDYVSAVDRHFNR